MIRLVLQDCDGGVGLVGVAIPLQVGGTGYHHILSAAILHIGKEHILAVGLVPVVGLIVERLVARYDVQPLQEAAFTGISLQIQ